MEGIIVVGLGLGLVVVRAGEAGKDCGPRSRLGSRMIVRIFNNNANSLTQTTPNTDMDLERFIEFGRIDDV